MPLYAHRGPNGEVVWSDEEPKPGEPRITKEQYDQRQSQLAEMTGLRPGSIAEPVLDDRGMQTVYEQTGVKRQFYPGGDLFYIEVPVTQQFTPYQRRELQKLQKARAEVLSNPAWSEDQRVAAMARIETMLAAIQPSMPAEDTKPTPAQAFAKNFVEHNGRQYLMDSKGNFRDVTPESGLSEKDLLAYLKEAHSQLVMETPEGQEDTITQERVQQRAMQLYNNVFNMRQGLLQMNEPAGAPNYARVTMDGKTTTAGPSYGIVKGPKGTMMTGDDAELGRISAENVGLPDTMPFAGAYTAEKKQGAALAMPQEANELVAEIMANPDPFLAEMETILPADVLAALRKIIASGNADLIRQALMSDEVVAATKKRGAA